MWNKEHRLNEQIRVLIPLAKNYHDMHYFPMIVTDTISKLNWNPLSSRWTVWQMLYCTCIVWHTYSLYLQVNNNYYYRYTCTELFKISLAMESKELWSWVQKMILETTTVTIFSFSGLEFGYACIYYMLYPADYMKLSWRCFVTVYLILSSVNSMLFTCKFPFSCGNTFNRKSAKV